MCRQGVLMENPHHLTQFPTLDEDLDPSHPQYVQITAQRRQIRIWKMKNKRISVTKVKQTQKNDESVSKKELRRIKNRESAAQSRKRKVEEMEGAKDAIEKLNEENFQLRQRLLELEQTVKSFKNHRDQSVHSRPSYIKPELTTYSKIQPEISLNQVYEQQPYEMKKCESLPSFSLLPSDYIEQQLCFDEIDPFGFGFNSDDFNELFEAPTYDFSNW